MFATMLCLCPPRSFCPGLILVTKGKCAEIVAAIGQQTRKSRTNSGEYEAATTHPCRQVG